MATSLNRLRAIALGTSSSSDLARGININSNGNVYVSGNTQGSLPGNTNLGNADAFIVGFDSNGNLLNTPTITLAVSPASVTEDGTPKLKYTFTRTGNLSSPLTVNYTLDGTAISNDYTVTGATSNTVTFGVNKNTATVTVDPTADPIIEPDETVTLTLATGAGYTIGTTSPVTGTIINDNVPPTVTLSLNYSGISEDSPSNFIYTFTRTGNLTNAFILTLAAGTGYTIGTSSPVTATIINDDGTRRQQATSGNDVILGKSGGDVIIGGLGNDILTGSSGGDLFTFQSPNEGIDSITDFIAGDDFITVKGSSFGGGLTSGDILNADQFMIGTAATTAAHRFIYNSATGALLFDSDGNGATAALQIATLNTGLALTNEAIFVS